MTSRRRQAWRPIAASSRLRANRPLPKVSSRACVASCALNSSSTPVAEVVVGLGRHLGEDVAQLVVGVVVEGDRGAEPAGEARVVGDEDLHRHRVAGDDHHQVVAVVLHLLHEGVDGLLAVLVAVEAVGLVDEQDAAVGLRRDLRGLDRGLAEVAGHQLRAVDLDQLALGEQPDRLVDAGHEAGDGGLAGAGVAGEDQVPGDGRALQARPWSAARRPAGSRSGAGSRTSPSPRPISSSSSASHSSTVFSGSSGSASGSGSAARLRPVRAARGRRAGPVPAGRSAPAGRAALLGERRDVGEGHPAEAGEGAGGVRVEPADVEQRLLVAGRQPGQHVGEDRRRLPDELALRSLVGWRRACGTGGAMRWRRGAGLPRRGWPRRGRPVRARRGRPPPGTGRRAPSA